MLNAHFFSNQMCCIFCTAVRNKITVSGKKQETWHGLLRYSQGCLAPHAECLTWVQEQQICVETLECLYNHFPTHWSSNHFHHGTKSKKKHKNFMMVSSEFKQLQAYIYSTRKSCKKTYRIFSKNDIPIGIGNISHWWIRECQAHHALSKPIRFKDHCNFLGIFWVFG